MKKHLWGIVYGTVLAAFTVYLLLDTFVIPRVYSSVSLNDGTAVSKSASALSKLEDGSSADSTDNCYSDGNITVTVTEQRKNGTTVYVADVRLTSAEYLKTALAKNAYGKNVTAKTSEIAESNNAVLAINGDYYGVRESGYVLRGGVIYRDTPSSGTEDLVIYKDGSFGIINEDEVSAKSLLSDGAEHILSFGPALLKSGRISVGQNEEVGKAMASNPRTAIGIIDALHYVFVVSDGRTDESRGLTLYELAEVMQSLGAASAYNLDGGGSSTMYFNGRVVNKPTTNGKSIKERSVSDIVYIG